MNASQDDRPGVTVLDITAQALTPEEATAAHRAVEIYGEQFAARDDERPTGCSSSSSFR